MPAARSNTSERDDEPFVEVDPTGRFGRYNDLLGAGAVKKVYRAFDQHEGIEVAWNKVRLRNFIEDPVLINRLHSEVQLLRTLKNKYIIVCYSVWLDEEDSSLNFITEVCTSGNLRDYRKKHRHVSLKALKKWSKQVLEGLEFLHTHDPCVIHRDLNCSNIFVNGNSGQVKIGDLGFAAIVGKSHTAHSILGTPEFMAPELYEEDYTEMVDIYSFGMCLLEMVTMEIPYSECDNVAKIYKKVTSGVKPQALNKVADPEVKAFILKCIAEPRARPSASDLLKDTFFSEVNDDETVPAKKIALGIETDRRRAGKQNPSTQSTRIFRSRAVVGVGIEWSQETGLPVSVRVRVGERTFHLHRNPLFSKSGYFKRRLIETTQLELPQSFPGGPETFEMISLFMYGSSTLIDPFNVAALRCAAEFLEMTEEFCSGNLCERFDLYLNQVVLQNWDDTLIVLQRCQALIPWSEELLIVSRCIESLAFMACMEILDPERRRDKPVATLEALAGQAWSCEAANEILSQELWIKDLIALPFGFFKRIIGSLRRQGMKEKYVSPIVVFYANKWVLSKKTIQYWESSGERSSDANANDKVSTILQGVLDLLPMREKASRVIPVGFYFALLSRSIGIGLRNDSKVKLQDQIASLLHFAQVEDLLIPSSRVDSDCSRMELATMESIFSTNVSLNMDTNNAPSASNSTVAELWDTFLSHIASDPRMRPKRFMELIETVPISCRQSHDQLYRAMNTFLQASLSQTSSCLE
ncbi:hypothetical protein D5086_026907 [Populus alba]|uniref:Uncharacterized protein n=1 Tax=Populus alba TaxID=43335 RepID=A0ACC4B4V5_POPAL